VGASADPCTKALRRLERHLERGHGEYSARKYRGRAIHLLAALRPGCCPRGRLLGEILVDRSLHRLDTAAAVDKLLSPGMLADESDQLALKALGHAARFSVAADADGERHVDLRRRALAIAERLGDAAARVTVLVNWLFAELARDNLDGARRYQAEAAAIVEADGFVVGAKTRELKARFLSHKAKVVLRGASPDAAAAGAIDAAGALYRDAIALVEDVDHLRVNLQIEHAAELASAALELDVIEVAAVRRLLDAPQRALATELSDEGRAYYYAASADVHELAAVRGFNRDRAAAVQAWKAAIADRMMAIGIYERAKHHFAQHERAELRRQQKELARVMQPQRIFLSHKSADKPFVEQVADALRELGFDPWFDQVNVVASDEVLRKLSAGIRESCATVFFVSERFLDDGYIRFEVSYAREAFTHNPAYKLIPLALPGPAPEIPELLRDLGTKYVKNELDAVRAILKALPIRVGTVRWKEDGE
jgi:hypothetical protein